MRHTRTRRRLKMILTAILAFTGVFFVETRIEAFAPELKTFAIRRIEERFNNTFRLRIGDMDGGILRPITLNNVRVEDASGKQIAPFLTIKRIGSNYRFWTLSSDRPFIFVSFATADGSVDGSLRVRGGLNDAQIKGYVSVFAKRERIEFSGTVKRDTFDVTVKPRTGTLHLDGKFSRDLVAADIKAEHLKFRDIDIVCEAHLKDRLIPDASGTKVERIEGAVETKRLILNYTPFPDIRASYTIVKDVLEIAELNIGSEFKLSGSLDLREPFTAQGALTAESANIATLLALFGVKSGSPLTGIMSGRVAFKGPLARLGSDVRLDIRDGTIYELGFDSLSARLRGDGSFFKIEESRIRRESGYVLLAGEFDLRKAGKKSFFENLKIASSETAILWDGVDITRRNDVDEVTMTKRVNDDMSLGFKKNYDDSAFDESIRPGDEYGLEYRLQGNENLKVSVGQDRSSFFGLEHKDKF